MSTHESNDSKQRDKSITISMEKFVEVLDNGSLGAELMERLRDVVERVRETGRKGYVQLRLNVDLAGAGQVEIEPQVKSKEPKTSHTQRLFYTDDSGHLYRQDPDQINLPLRSPDGADAETKRSVDRN